MTIDLYLELQSLQGRHTVGRRVDLPWVPRSGDQLLLENGLLCKVEQTTGRMDGTVELRLRLATPAQADALLPQLLRSGWAQVGEALGGPQPMR